MATSLINGFVPPSLDVVDEVQEYEKILRLRDEIFAGTHPRLTVPAHAIRKVSPLSTSQSNLQSYVPSSEQQTRLPGLSMNGAADDGFKGVDLHVNNNTTTAQVKTTTASGIDPVLLMKSDELVKAEFQLQRQRLEKALRDQFEQKRLDARKRPAAGEAKPDFDVTAILTKAQDVVKPEGTSTPKEDASENGSYDENSLYSSRAPDSTPEVGELEDSASPQNQIPSGPHHAANGPTETQALQPQVDRVMTFPAIADPPSATARKASGPADLSMVENDDEEEEGEYSPPEAMEQVGAAGESGSQTLVDPRTRTLRRYSELDEHGKAPGSPGDFPRMNLRPRNGRPNQRGQSPDGSGQGLHPRKKRKLDKKSDRRKRGGSPDVKDEPVSPPPFHDVQPLGSGRIRSSNDDRPIIIDDGPVREVRYAPAPDPYLNSPVRPMSRQGEQPMPASEPRVISRSHMRPVRDEVDLRRVASMHNMRAEQPREYVEQVYEPQIRMRAASYVPVDSPMRMEPARIVQDVPPAYEREMNSGVRAARSPAPAYREVYTGPEPEVRYIQEPMQPATVERIVIDQYGRKFREIIQDRSSVAPRAYSTYPDRGQPTYYETYDHGRGQSVVVEPRHDTRLGQHMPPPPPQMIRQAPEPGPAYREVYEPLAPQRSGSVRPVEQSPRPPVYFDERAEYRPPARISSVRPTPNVRYEEMPPPPPSMVPRGASVQPGAREGSVYVEDRPQMRREYLPMETPRYRVVEPETRYIDAHGREITYVDGGQDGGSRYVQRY